MTRAKHLIFIYELLNYFSDYKHLKYEKSQWSQIAFSFYQVECSKGHDSSNSIFGSHILISTRNYEKTCPHAIHHMHQTSGESNFTIHEKKTCIPIYQSKFSKRWIKHQRPLYNSIECFLLRTEVSFHVQHKLLWRTLKCVLELHTMWNIIIVSS